MKNILVTGAGALLGQGILRCLNFSENTYNIISADPDVYATGHALADSSCLIPMVNNPDYLNQIKSILKEYSIDIVLIGTDVELPIFSKNQAELEKEFGLKIIISNEEVIKIANDKWLTAQFLKQNNFPFPQSAMTSDANGIEALRKKATYPYIAKPVDGARSKGLVIVNNDEELISLTNYKNNLVVQEMISDEEGELTTGCVVVKGVCKAVVSLTRDLRDGNTWRAFRKCESPYDNKIAEIAEKLGVEGPVNFQYRIRNGEPVIFEINGRFSGTTPLRYMFGFNEVEALIEYYLNGKEISKPSLKSGTVLRTFSDLYVEEKVIDTFKKDQKVKPFEAKYYPFTNK